MAKSNNISEYVATSKQHNYLDLPVKKESLIQTTTVSDKGREQQVPKLHFYLVIHTILLLDC